MIGDGANGKVKVSDEFSVCEDIFKMRSDSGQEVEAGNGEKANLAIWEEGLNSGVQHDEGDAHIGGMSGDAVRAGS